jgi:8-oxo-dGTP pyrophosphatase MutT (NUDIX family)
MPISPYVQGLRQKVGHDLVFLPGVSAVVVNDKGEILLHQRSDFRTWALPSGILDPGENPADAIVREVFEETAVQVEPIRISGVYTTPTITYPNGDQARYVITTFLCRPTGGPGPRVNDDESLDVRYFHPSKLPLPDLRPDHRLRIEHALSGSERAYFNINSKNNPQ